MEGKRRGEARRVKCRIHVRYTRRRDGLESDATRRERRGGLEWKDADRIQMESVFELYRRVCEQHRMYVSSSPWGTGHDPPYIHVRARVIVSL